MSYGRYTYIPRILARTTIATSVIGTRIYKGVTEGDIRCSTYIIKENERLDHVAAKKYGASTMWWVIAAASGIGWGLQVPPGTILRIPTSAGQIISLLR